MYTETEILDSLINGQMSQATRQFHDSSVELVQLYHHAMNITNDEILGDKVLRMADSLIDRKL